VLQLLAQGLEQLGLELEQLGQQLRLAWAAQEQLELV
jgi:hypothetical protein